MFLVTWALCQYEIFSYSYYVHVFTPIKAMSLCVFVSSCAILQFKILLKIQLNSLKRSCLEGNKREMT